MGQKVFCYLLSIYKMVGLSREGTAAVFSVGPILYINLLRWWWEKVTLSCMGTENILGMAFIMSLEIKPVKMFPHLETTENFWIKDLVSNVLCCCQGASQPLKHVALLPLSCQFKNRCRGSKLSMLLSMVFSEDQGRGTGQHLWCT